LTPARIGDLISPDLARLAHHYQALLTAIVDELGARHLDIAEELVGEKVCALQDELAATKQHAREEHSRAHELDHENRRLRDALTAGGEASTSAE
jgi:hypothetical protein